MERTRNRGPIRKDHNGYEQRSQEISRNFTMDTEINPGRRLVPELGGTGTMQVACLQLEERG